MNYLIESREPAPILTNRFEKFDEVGFLSIKFYAGGLNDKYFF